MVAYVGGVSLKVLAQRFGLRDAHAARSRASTLRAQGYHLQRPASCKSRGLAGKRAWVDAARRAGYVCPTMPESEIQAATIMDAEGRVIGSIDPITRERQMLELEMEWPR